MRRENTGTYHALHTADKQTVEDLTGLVGVTDILESLGTVLATDIKEDLLTTAVYILVALFRKISVVVGRTEISIG